MFSFFSLKESYPKTATIDFNISAQDTEATKKLVQLVCELPDILSAALRNPKAEVRTHACRVDLTTHQRAMMSNACCLFITTDQEQASQKPRRGAEGVCQGYG